MRDEIKVTVIATGFPSAAAEVDAASSRRKETAVPVRASQRDLRSTVTGMPAVDETSAESEEEDIAASAKAPVADDRRASFIRSHTGSVRQVGGGLSPTEEEQMDVPTFLRQPPRRRNE